MRLFVTSLGAGLTIGLFMLACSSCSGATVVDGDDGGASSGGSSGSSGSPRAACPAQDPAQGAPCAAAGLACEYGGTGTRLLCSTLATCNGTSGSATWFVTPPSKDCIPDRAHNPSWCPPSFGALASGAACPAGATGGCTYDEGICGCISCAADGGASSQQQEWSCKTYPKPQGCPDPRPLVGSPCATEDQGCAYGGTCNVLNALPALTCNSGRWTRQPFAASCAMPKCGG